MSIGQTIADRLGLYGDLSVFQVAAVCHLRFLKFRNFNWQCALPCQIRWRSVEPLARYNGFSILKMADVRHLGFLNI